MNQRVQIPDMQTALGFMMHQREHIEAEVIKRPMPEVKYSRLIPVDTSANKFASSVSFFVQDHVGQAKFISGKGDDIPLVNVGMSKHEAGIQDGGIGYSFSLMEIGAAMMLNQSLPTEGAFAARQSYEQLVDETVFVGNEQINVQGLYNTTGIGTVAAPNTFTNMTAKAILGVINGAITATMTATKGIDIADTVVLPIEQWGYITTEVAVEGNTITILEFIQKSNAYTAKTGKPLTIEADHRLDGKMVVYKRSPEVLKLHMPMPLEFIAPQPQGLNITTYGMFRFSEVNIRRPKAIRYVEGI